MKSVPLHQVNQRCYMELRPHYRTIVLSDIHLGTTHSKVDEVSDFLSSVDCDRLILNGDIIDGWHLQKSGVKKWKSQHTRFFKIIMKMMEKCGTEIIYVRGNHDDFLDNLAPLQFANISIVKDYILESNGRHYFVTHGDVFDKVTTEMKWLAQLGDVGYTILLWMNGMYNKYAWESKYWSEFKNIKEYNQNTVDNECVSFNNVNIRVIRRNIVLETVQNTHVSIYNINGTLVFSSSVKNNVSIPLQSGFYIVKYNDETKKIAIL